MPPVRGAALMSKVLESIYTVQVRAVESLPNATQVNFSPYLDLLLAEMVRHCKATTP